MTGGECALRVGQPLGHSVGLAGQGETPRVRHAELRVARHGSKGQRVEPTAYRAQLTGVEVTQRGVGYENGGVAEIARLERVPDGLDVIAPALVPRRRPSVQTRDLDRMAHRQPRTEDLREQRVIPVPAALVVERDDEQVGTLGVRVQPRLSVRLARDGIAERIGTTDRGRRCAGQELLRLVRQSGENLLDDVIEDEAVAGPEPMHELGPVLSARAVRRRPAAAPLPTLRSARRAPQPQPAGARPRRIAASRPFRRSRSAGPRPGSRGARRRARGAARAAGAHGIASRWPGGLAEAGAR